MPLSTFRPFTSGFGPYTSICSFSSNDRNLNLIGSAMSVLSGLDHRRTQTQYAPEDVNATRQKSCHVASMQQREIVQVRRSNLNITPGHTTASIAFGPCQLSRLIRPSCRDKPQLPDDKEIKSWRWQDWTKRPIIGREIVDSRSEIAIRRKARNPKGCR
jgi:hypothetical protein